MEDYIEYLITKLVVFEKGVELDESNCVDDILKIRIEKSKKVTDDSMRTFTQQFLGEYLCFEIVDTEFSNRINEYSCLYDNYKLYRSNNKIQSIIKDDTLDTSKVLYSQSISLTRHHLEHVYGEAIELNSTTKNWNIEYKFKMGKDIFSVYDWKGDDRLHLASNTVSKVVIGKFISELERNVKVDCC